MIQISIFRVISLSAALCGSSAVWAQDEKVPALEEYYFANAPYNRKLYPVAIAQDESFLSHHATHPMADLVGVLAEIRALVRSVPQAGKYALTGSARTKYHI